MKKYLTSILAFAFLLAILASCAAAPSATFLNGISLSDFTIVYAPDAPDYCQRAAQYIQQQILEKTGVELAVCQTSDGAYPHEIVVGETDRAISAQLDAETEGLEFSLMADENHIALEGDYFIIAAAAYYFVETYITGNEFSATVPQQTQICSPITAEANNFLILIGDGMGFNHTLMYESMTPSDSVPYTDNEDFFYGYLLPYQGVVHTSSLTGTTDSAAAATALSCGYKTYNGYVGVDPEGQELTSLTELALSKNMAAAVMSTDRMVGATPAAFSSHALDRDDSATITKFQQAMIKQGLLLDCNLDATKTYQQHITDTLDALIQQEKGIFLMYEEGHIDKHAAKSELQETFDCVVRFNQAIGVFMEFAFYHPDTLLVITADHETGGLTKGEDGAYAFTTEEHTPVDVPIFAYGQGAEAFADFSAENTEVPKVIAALWGVADFGN